ncbi:MAG: hypothetical protein ACFFED_07345 [Candidatus Thorarchaeota archaeon]
MKQNQFHIMLIIFLLGTTAIPIWGCFQMQSSGFIPLDTVSNNLRLYFPSDVFISTATLWNETFAGEGMNEVWDLVETPSGTLFAAGSTEYEFGGGDYGQQIYWLSQTLDASLKTQSHTGSNGTEAAYSVARTSDGLYHMVGLAETWYPTSAGGTDVYLQSVGSALYSPDSYYGGPENDVGWSITAVNGEDLAIGGSTESFGHGMKDVWFLFIESENIHTGEELGAKTPLSWNRTYGGPDDDEAFSVISCSGGGFALAGYTESNGNGNKDGWLLRINQDGDQLWNVTLGGASDDVFYSLIECSEGGFALVGTTLSLGSGAEDLWMVRTDATGQLLWQQTFGGSASDFGRDIIEASDGRYAMVGYTKSSGAGNFDAWFLLTDINGTLIHERTHGGSAADGVYAVIESDFGGFAIAGYTESYAADNRDAWLIRIPELSPPEWSEPLTDQTGFSHANFSYDLNVSDSSAIASWSLNDTSIFSIDRNGIITNAVDLLAGVYGIEVSVSDEFGNILIGMLTITIVDDLTHLILGIAGVGIASILVLSLFVCVRKSKLSSPSSSSM